MRFAKSLAAPLIALALVAAACGDSGSKSSNSAAPTTAGGAATTAGSTGTTAGGSTATTAATSDATGTVTVFNAMEPAEATALQAVVDQLITPNVKYKATIEQSSDFETQAKIRIQGGNPPEILMFPQPGTVLEQAKAGKAIALEDMGFTSDQLEQTFGKYLMSLVEYNGKHYGLPTNVNLKSMIWYPKAAFDAKGYTIPKTWDELVALSDKIKADGSTPWCVGFESGGATGWPATDWMEDIMLRTAGPDTYDKWVSHAIPFTDPTVKKAAQLFGQIMFTDGYVLGGAANTTSINFGDAPTPMFDNPPKCWLHRQASFINGFFPKTAVAGKDYDWFPFPSITTAPDAALMAGEYSTVFKDTPAVRDFLQRFSGVEVQCAQGKQTSLSRISPNLGVTSDCYANPQLARAADVVNAALKAGSGRFDASDQMPSAVGSGSFWTGMVKYVQSGADSLQGVLSDIDKSWPAS